MIRPTRTVRLLAVSAAAALLLTSCGSDDNNGDGGGDTPSDSPSDTAPAKKGDGTLTVGVLQPQTGDLAFLGPPQFAGIDLAIKDINAAGGVLGNQVKSIKADEGDGTPNIAGQSADKLLDGGADVIIGAAASSVSLSVLDKLVGAGVMEISGSNTAAELDDYPDKGLYFRTAPSDALQGAVLGDLVVKDGNTNVGILARQDSYGQGLADQVETTIEEKGATVSKKVLYAADAKKFNAEVSQIAASKPEALVLISFEEGVKIIPQLVAAGIGPQDIPTYLVDGNTADYSKEDFDVSGVKGTIPSPEEVPKDFNDLLLGINPKLDSFTYGPQDYDATVMAALAATAAGDDAGVSMATKMVEISSEGTECTTYADCVKLLEDGEDIDYNGVSGPVDLNDAGSVSKATISINLYDNSNKFKQIDSVSGVLE